MEEIWKSIKNYEGLFEVSNLGRVKTLKREYVCGNHHSVQIQPEKIMSLTTVKGGYLRVSLSKNGKRNSYLVHRLVAEAFIPNCENKPTVNHKDHNVKNNSVENLEWATYGEQFDEIRKVNFRKATLNKGRSIPVRCIETGAIYPSATYIERELGISASSICLCCNGKYKTCNKLHWKYERN